MPVTGDHPILKSMLGSLRSSLGTRLKSVVLYGSAARGDFDDRTSDLNLILVLEDLEPSTLEALTGALRDWRARGQPTPRLFSPDLIRRSADVFPIEFLDIQAAHVALEGEDPFDGLPVGRDNLRLQCERELREKMMRLREGYAEASGSEREVKRLIAASYGSFAALFRGCLHLLGPAPPARGDDAVGEFCRRTGLDARPFEAAARLRRGGTEGNPRALFAAYHEQLTRAIAFVDRLPQGGGDVR